MELTKAKSLNLDEFSSMKMALNSNKHLEPMIDVRMKIYYMVDISKVMTNLGNVGEILKLAYAGSKGFPCSTSTLKILSRYQTMIKNSYVTSSSFVGACLNALQLHKLALVMAEKGKMDSSIKMLEKCAELAKTMADESGKLVKEATDLCNLSEEALLTAQNDENVSKEEKERIKKIMTESKARQVEMASKANEERQRNIIEVLKKSGWFGKKTVAGEVLAGSVAALAGSVAALADSDAGAVLAGSVAGAVLAGSGAGAVLAGSVAGAVLAGSVAGAVLVKGVNVVTDQLHTVLGTVSGTLKNEENITSSGSEATTKEEGQKQTNTTSDVNNNTSATASLAQQENEIMKLKAELQKEERDANAEIAKVGEILKGLTGHEADLTASIASLEMAIKALGKVKTTFEQTRQFWLGVEKHCKTLTNVSVIKELNDPNELNDFKDEFIETLKKSGLSWLTLGKINYTAQLFIADIDKRTDNILSNLPTKLEALEVFKNDADSIISSFQNEATFSKIEALELVKNDEDEDYIYSIINSLQNEVTVIDRLIVV